MIKKWLNFEEGLIPNFTETWETKNIFNPNNNIVSLMTSSFLCCINNNYTFRKVTYFYNDFM